jgi:sRNA-binding carbon storage regulator CsrA
VLVLSRHKEERIRITVPPSDKEQVIDITIVDIRETTTRIGLTADRSIAINRLEVEQRIHAGVPVTTPQPVRVWSK